MKRQSRELLAAQLDEALLALQAGEGEAFEVAVLAGLLSRGAAPGRGEPAATTEPPTDRAEQALAEARQLRDEGKLLADRPADDAADDIVTQLYALSEGDSEDECAELLLDLDELCAGSTFVGQLGRCREAAQEAAAAIRTFPAQFSSLAGWASQLLAEEPPVKADPAWLFWRALEACAFPDPIGAPVAPTCDAARRKLGIGVTVSRRMAGAAPQAMHAASDLPLTPALLPLGSGPGFEVGLGRDASGEPALIMACSSLATLLHEGHDVPLECLAPNLLRAPAAAGTYTLRVGDDVFLFEVVD